MDLLDIFYSTTTGQLLAECALLQLVLESLGRIQALLCLWPAGACLAPPEPCLSCPWPAGTSLTSSTPCLSCPWPAGTSLTSSTPLFILSMTCWNFSNIFYTLFILSMTCWNFSNIFCTLFILSTTSWNFSNIFCKPFILPTTCWGFSKTHFFIRYPSPCSSFILTEGGLFTLTVEALSGCDKGTVCIIWWERSTYLMHISIWITLLSSIYIIVWINIL